MKRRLINQQSEPRSREAANPLRLSVKARIMMALFALMLIPQGAWAQNVEYNSYDTSKGKFVKATVASGHYELLTGNSSATLENGKTYVVSGTETFNNRLIVDGTVNIILCDGATFTANWGITVSTGDVLNVYAQSEGTGKLFAYGFSDAGSLYAAIGDANYGASHSIPADYGYVNIYGGQIIADASSIIGASGIGGFSLTKSCVTTIYGGNVDAMGGPSDPTTNTNIPTYGIANLKLGSGVIYYGGSSPNPTTDVAYGPQSSISTLYRYMSTKENVYDLTVDGKQVRTTNANDILFSGGTTPTASFDVDNNTLFLNGLDISGNISSNLPNLTVRFVGTNNINTDALSSFPYSAAYNAISSTNSSATLTIERSGDGKLVLDGREDYSAIAGFASVSYGDGCYLHSTQPIKYSSDDKRFINFANGNAPVSVVSISSDICYPLWIGTSTITTTQVTTTAISAGVTFTPAKATTLSKLTLSGATLNAKIISALGDLVIDVSGTNTITSPDSGTVIRSANAGKLTLVKSSSDASLQLKGASGSNHPVIQGFSSLLYPDFALETTPAANYGNFNDGSNDIIGLYYPSVTNNSKKAVNDAEFTSVVSYDLWVANTRVTATNKGDVLTGANAGKVIYTPDATSGNSGTLTLNGVTIDGTIVSGLDNLTIEIKNGNNLTGTSGYISSTNVTGTLTIKKGADGSSLRLTNTTGPSAVEGFSSVTLDGTYLRASFSCEYIGGTTKAYQYHATDDMVASNVQTLEFTTQHYYPLWVKDVQVNEVELNDVLDDGTVSFSSVSGTNYLTLNGALIDSSNGIESGLDNLTIVIKGINSINTNTPAHYYPIYSYVPTAPLTIQKDAAASYCSLTLSSSSGIPQVVKGFTSVSHNGLDFNATAGTGTSLTDTNTKGAKLSSVLFGGGDGTYSTPYLIKTKEDLKNLATYTNTGLLDTDGKYFNLVQNIDCTGLTGFEPIGTSTHPFKGYLEGLVEGDRHTISNLTYTTSNASADVGLFGVIDKKNFGVAHVNMQNCSFSGGARIGTVAGYLASGTIWDCTITYSTVSSGDTSAPHAGGLAGESSGWIANCYVGISSITATISKGNAVHAGGLVGYMSGGEMKANWSDGNTVVSMSGTPVDAYAGAIVGFKSGGTFGVNSDNGNYACLYTSSGSVETNVAGVTEAKTGNMARGIGNSADIPNSAALGNTFKVTLGNDATKGTVSPKADTYYTYTGPDVYAARFTDVTIVVTPVDGFRPTLSLSDANITVTSKDVNDGSGNYSHTEFTFSMPSADVIATANYIIDISSNSFTASIDNTTYNPTGSLAPTTVTLTSKGGSAIILDSNNNDFTIITKTLNGAAAEFINAGTYVVTIQGKGNYTGIVNINYTIDQAQATIIKVPSAVTGLTYDGSFHNLVNPGTVTEGTMKYSLNYDAADDAWTTTIPQGKNASGNTPYEVYYMVAGNTNYKGVAKSTNNKVEVTILPKTISNDNTVISLNSSSFVYSSTSSQQPSITSVSVDNTELTETQDYVATIPSGTDVNTYTVTITGTGNYTGNATTTFGITSAPITPSVTITGWTYGSSANSPSVEGNPGNGGVTYEYKKSTDADTEYSGTAPTAVGNYTVRATIASTANYQSGTATANFTISAASIDPSVTITGWTYGSAANAPSVAGNPGNGAVTYEYKKSTDADTEYSGTVPTAAGTYTVRATIASTANYQGGTTTADFTIDQATLTSVEIDQTLFTYAPGVTHYVTITAYAGTIPVPAGSITVTVDGVATNGASTIGTHTVRATARTDIANNFRGYAENTFKIQEHTINIAFGGRAFRTFYDAGDPFLIPNNMTAYIVTGVSDNAVTLKKVSFVQAGVPVLLESTPGTTNVADPAETFTGNLLKYATATVITDGSQYILYSDEFVKATGTITGKVYLDLTGLPSPARAFTIRTENTTAIETVDNSELTDDNWYDMQGRKINKPTKTGIYIKDGKKVVVKTRY